MQPRKGTKIAAARRIALEVLRRVEAEGAYTQLCLNHALRRHGRLSQQDKALATELVYGTLRFRRRLDFGLAAYSSRPLEKIEPLLLRILRMSAYQLLMLDRVPAWAAVDQGTELAGTIRGRRAAGFVNGVLRALSARRDQIEWPDPANDPIRALGIIHSFPDWMVQRWLYEHDQDRAVAIMEACNRPAPVWVRTNSLRITPEGLGGLLATSGYEATEDKLVPGALRLSGTGDISRLAAHETGLLHVQDAAAQAVCHLLDARPGQRVLDACGAPGGKTATVAQLMKDKGEILSIDVNPARVSLSKKLLERLGIGCVERLAHDLLDSLPQGLTGFDRVLLDAPCSALGVIRRHPESKWRLFPDDLKRLSETQYKLLDNVCRAVKPGGYLVYSVCSFSEEEGPGLIDEWLGKHSEFSIDDPRQHKRAAWHKLLDGGGRLLTRPDLHDMDAFFAVRLVRAGASH